jgi:ribonuclease P protein component
VAGFPRERRIHRSAEIRAIVEGGQSGEGPNLRVHARVDLGRASPVRAVVVVPRFGRTAVERNRLKRRLRELTRLHLLEAPGLVGGDLVIKAGRGAYARTFPELREELLDVAERLARRLAREPGQERW